jgi:hypothetical protein
MYVPHQSTDAVYSDSFALKMLSLGAVSSGGNWNWIFEPKKFTPF